VPNKTIYVRDEALWNKAKKIAEERGDGLSGVIASALARLVADEEAKEGGEVHRILIVPMRGESADPERIGFVGKRLAESELPSHYEGLAQLVATAYQTAASKIVVTLAEQGEHHPFTYAVCHDLNAIPEHDELTPYVNAMDWFEWIREIEIQQADGKAKEVWID
jgi:hypothetical protein